MIRRAWLWLTEPRRALWLFAAGCLIASVRGELLPAVFFAFMCGGCSVFAYLAEPTLASWNSTLADWEKDIKDRRRVMRESIAISDRWKELAFATARVAFPNFDDDFTAYCRASGLDEASVEAALEFTRSHGRTLQ